MTVRALSSWKPIATAISLSVSVTRRKSCAPWQPVRQPSPKPQKLVGFISSTYLCNRAVKDNQPRLRADIQLLFEPPSRRPGWNVPTFALRRATQPEIGHGRIERRTLTASSDLRGYLDWPYAQQVFRYEYHYHELRSGKRGHQVNYGITSLSARQASAERLLQLLRGHWGIENACHYRRDVTLKEDAGHWRVAQLTHMMAVINNLVLSLLLRLGDNLRD